MTTPANVADTPANVADATANVADATANVADATANVADTTANVADTTANHADTTTNVADTTTNHADAAAHTLTARMTNPVFLLDGALPALMELGKATAKAGLPRTTALLVQLRASQINGCGYCVDMHAAELQDEGEDSQRLFAVSAWREAPFFTPAERAALALTEAATRLADSADPVPDAVWDEARAHYDEPGLAALIMEIAQINFWNRLNVTTRQIAGTGWAAQAREAARERRAAKAAAASSPTIAA